jgi:hypothetical protein
MSDCIAACNAGHSTGLPPSLHQLLSACCWAAGDCPAGYDVAKLSKRYSEMHEAALSHPAWGENWGGYKAATIARLLTCSDARLRRLALLIERGWQGRYSMYTVLTMTNARWNQALKKLELEQGARGGQQPQDTKVRQREWVFAKHPLGADAPHAALVQQAAAGQDAAGLEPAATCCCLTCRCRPLLPRGSRRPRAAGEAGAGGQLQPRLGRSSQQQRRMAARRQAPAARHAAAGRCGSGGPARRRRRRMAVPMAQVAQHSARGRCDGSRLARRRRSQGAI